MTDIKIISKIEKLLSLAGNNPSEAEAQAAMLKAQELMAENNLSMESLNPGEKKTQEASIEYVKGGQNSRWVWTLARTIADNFRCNFLRSPGYGVAFVGLKEDLTICIQVFNFASETLEKNMMKLRRQYRKEGLPTDGISGDYCAGFLKGLKDKFQEQVDKKGWGLVLVKDKAVVEYTDKIKDPKPNKANGSKLSRSGDASLYNKGYLDGKSIVDPHQALRA